MQRSAGRLMHYIHRKAGETDDTQYGIYETGSDRNADNYGEIHIAGLPWGDYYFVEAKAPVGYDLNTEHVTFSIGRDSVQNTVYLETVDQRSKGSIRLTKRDKNNPVQTPAGCYIRTVYDRWKKMRSGN